MQSIRHLDYVLVELLLFGCFGCLRSCTDRGDWKRVAVWRVHLWLFDWFIMMYLKHFKYFIKKGLGFSKSGM